MVVLFWFDLWEIFILPTPGFQLGTSGSLVLHSTTVPQQLQVFTSDNFRYWTLVQRDWWWYCSDWTCERFSFCPHQGVNWGPLNLYSCTLPLWHDNFWFSPLSIPGNELWCRGIGGGIVLIGLREIFIFPTPGFELGTSGSWVLHSTTVPQWLLIFIYENFRSWTLLQRDWWWYCSDWTCERFYFCPHKGLNWGPLHLKSCTLPLCHLVISGFHLWQFQVLRSSAEGLVVVLFWLDLWEIFFLPTPGFELGTSGSQVLHSTTVVQWFLVFTSDNFRYWPLVQRDWWWYCSDWTCERFSFSPHQGLNWGPLDL